MKELTRFEMAAVKRTAQNVKNMRRKKEKLEEKQAALTTEINQLSEMINIWEQPIIKLTGGFTSEQVLNEEMNTEVATKEEVEVISDETLDDSPNEYIKQVETGFRGDVTFESENVSAEVKVESPEDYPFKD